jgi:sec-independent protein translocase protein TatA
MVGDILQPTHLLFVLVVALLVLGPKRLPEVGRTLGNGIRDFRAAINGETAERREEIHSEPWHSEPDPEPQDKHEFAHTSEGAPESHEFGHGEPPTPTSDHELISDQPRAAVVAAPTGASDASESGEKHEFAFESTEPADKPAGPLG